MLVTDRKNIYTFHFISVALLFSANTPSKADYLSPHYWCSDRHPGGFTHQLPNQNLTVQKISTTKWSFEPDRVFPSDIMDPDEEMVGGAHPKRHTRPPAYLQQYEVQYARGRPVAECDVTHSWEAPVLPHHSSLTPLHLVVTWSVLMAHRSCPQVISLHSMLNSINHPSPHLEWLVSLLLHTIESYRTCVMNMHS